MNRARVLLAIFDAHSDVQDALDRFAAADLPPCGVSVVGRSHHVIEQTCCAFRAADGAMRYRGRHEGFWNDLWERLPGAAITWVPTVGTLVVAGGLAGRLADRAAG